MAPCNEDDRQLLEKCISGDRQASGLFVQRFSDLVYKSVQYTFFSKHIQFKQDDLDDIHNTVFVQLFENKCKKLRQYEGRNGCSIATWVRTVTVRIVLNHIRKKGFDSMDGRKKLIPLEDLPELREKTGEPWALMEKSEQERLVRDGIENLPARDKLLITLHFNQGLPLSEVAETMGLSVKNAYTVKHRAVQKLKSYVESVENK